MMKGRDDDDIESGMGSFPPPPFASTATTSRSADAKKKSPAPYLSLLAKKMVGGGTGSIMIVLLPLLVVVMSLVAVVTMMYTQQRKQHANYQTTLQDLYSLQSTIEMMSNEQSAAASKWKTLASTVDSTQRSLTESFDSKIATSKSQLAAFQSDLANLRSAVEGHAASLERMKVLEGQIEMLRRMFGLGPELYSPQGGGGNGGQQQQQQQRQPAQPFRPGGLPDRQEARHQEQQQQYSSPPSEINSQQHPDEEQAFKHGFDRAKDLPDATRDLPEAERNRARAESVRAEIGDSWRAYRKYAWGHDELCPNSMRHKDWGGSQSHGLALTAVDSLSTLWLAGMHDEFHEAVKLVTKFVDYDQDISVSVFETIIRVVGGLLSAYELSGESTDELLETAAYVMDKLLYAFNTSTGIPHQTTNLKTHEHWNPEWSNGASILSEFGSVQLELRTLSFHTGNPVYDQKATHLMKLLEAKCQDMVCPTLFDVASGETRSDHITLGALGDSYYEYLVKQYVLTDRTEATYREMATRALDALHVRLFRYSVPSHQGYFGEFVDGGFDHKMDHLACFAGGMYALASMTTTSTSDHAKDSDGKAAARSQTYRKVAVELTETCYQMYDSQASGIGPEIVEFAGGQDFRPGEAYYLLRPEAIESIFYLWRLTKDEKYRTYQWKIFQHLKEYCKSSVTSGYSGLTMVSLVPPEQDDLMQSFWLAETLKYIYLTFMDDATLDLDKWVFNTEAHPLKIRRRDPLDVWRDWEAGHDGAMPWLPPFVEGVGAVETETMMQARIQDGSNFRRVTPVDPLGSDMKPMDGGEYTDPDARVAYDPNDDVFKGRQPTRHEVKWRKARRVSKNLGVPQE
jgi:mannosyl-oligosaccharide alpha-1,2-mannosidase